VNGTDNNHCGSCLNSCATSSGLACSGGQCVCNSSAPPTPTLNTAASITTACVGTTAKLAVTPSTGYAFQWFKTGSSTPLTDGASYSGTTTATLSLLNVTTATGNATYFVKMTGAACAGSASSDSFVVTVPSPPTLSSTNFVTSTLTVYGSNYSGMYRWDVQASGGNGLSYTFTWYQNGATTSVGTSGYDSTYAENAIWCGLSGTWSVSVMDANGCTATTSPVTITTACATGYTCSGC
jgi:hypothetical protein